MSGAYVCGGTIIYRDKGSIGRAVRLSRDHAVLQRHREETGMGGQTHGRKSGSLPVSNGRPRV